MISVSGLKILALFAKILALVFGKRHFEEKATSTNLGVTARSLLHVVERHTQTAVQTPVDVFISGSALAPTQLPEQYLRWDWRIGTSDLMGRGLEL